ncbi:hypothetical protein PF049_00120 [Erythrobacteraceae bacterium WH01K]|nr:hypothetical protein PF049_00120 [Erythrobacteraceae bacterium WH01K]
MPTIPHKFAAALIATAFALAAIFMGWSRYDAAQERATELEAQLKTANEELDHVQTVLDAVDDNAETTREIDERTRRIKDEVDALQETQECVNSDSVRLVIDRLQSYQQSIEDNVSQ